MELAERNVAKAAGGSESEMDQQGGEKVPQGKDPVSLSGNDFDIFIVECSPQNDVSGVAGDRENDTKKSSSQSFDDITKDDESLPDAADRKGSLGIENVCYESSLDSNCDEPTSLNEFVDFQRDQGHTGPLLLIEGELSDSQTDDTPLYPDNVTSSDSAFMPNSATCHSCGLLLRNTGHTGHTGPYPLILISDFDTHTEDDMSMIQAAGNQNGGPASPAPEVEADRPEDEAGEEESTDEKTPLTIRIPETGQNGNVSVDTTITPKTATPKTPAEKVRFILSNEREEDAGITLHEDFNLAHGLFCQMDILCHFESEESGWKEYARWLKYEEMVDPSNRWSKPYVATTTTHALSEVKDGLSNGTLILNLDAPHGCLNQVVDGDPSLMHLRLVMENITEIVAKEKKFDDETKRKFLEVLLKPHKHKHRKGAKKGQKKDEFVACDLSETGQTSTPIKESKGNDTKTSLLNGSPNASKLSTLKTKLNSMKKTMPQTEEEVSALYHTYPKGAQPDTLLPYKPNKKLMRKIPGGSEVANILVGQVDFLEEPVFVFTRLSRSAFLSDLTEVSIPTRFIFLVLGPPESTSIWEYKEVGRAAASLLSDKIFCEVAYKAVCRQDLLDGVDEYIDDLTVLPPSLWDPNTRLEPPEKTIAEDKIKARLDSARYATAPEAYHFGASAAEGDPSLTRTGRLFGGMISDIKRRYPYMWSDYKDGFHIQCLATIIFLFFACITPIVTFGGLMGQATDNYMGTMEMLLSGAICGLIYHIFAGQPLTIVGATGPLLVFEAIVYHTCHENGIDFLSFRLWVGVWICILLFLIVMFDLSYLVQYITRFTEESFAVLISLIFIYEAFSKTWHIEDKYPIHKNTLNEDALYRCYCISPGNSSGSTITLLNQPTSAPPYELVNASTPKPVYELYNWTAELSEHCITYLDRVEVSVGCVTEDECLLKGWNLEGLACDVHSVTRAVPDVFFLCCFLFLGTFIFAYALRMLRTSSYFPSIMRTTLADFAVLISIIICTGIDLAVRLNTPKLLVPSEFKTTRSDRTWVVNPMAFGGDRWYLTLLAIFPAFLATILIFLDQQITSVIVNRKEHKLQKGHGYHLDIAVLLVLILICSLLGLPWFVAATVRSITHVKSLIRESEIRAPGERPQFLGVREQRLTGVGIHLLIGLSVLCTPILKYIPMAVLYGVFLYMGVTSLNGVQFVDRILIYFMPKKFQPDHIYLRHVPTSRVHIFTAIQVICMVIMWVLKSQKKVSIIFPLMILALCFIRKLLDYIFSQNEMYWLDHLLPDATRRDLEDEGKDIEMSAINELDSSKDVDSLKLESPTRPEKKKRRPRQLSSDVIRRYRQRFKKGSKDSKDENENAGSPGYDDSFRARKFQV